MAYTKTFSWSYSKYKNWKVCPKRHYEVDLQKNYTESSVHLTWGNEVHDGLAKACTGAVPLPDNMKDYQHWVSEMQSGPGALLVEQKLAITKDFQPCGWSDWNNAWYRAVVDAVRIDHSVALARDWKTGKPQHDSRQLMLNTQTLFSHYPKLRRVKTEFVWLKDGYATPETFDRATIAHEWPPVLAEVAEMQEAARTNNYPPKPNHFCHHNCPVLSCTFHGKRV